MQQPEQRPFVRVQLLCRMALYSRNDPGDEPARLAHLDDGDQRAILIQSGEASAQVIRLRHGALRRFSLQRRLCLHLVARPIASLDLFAGIIPAGAAALGGLDRLAVDDPGRGAGFATRGFARFHQQFEVDPLQNAVVAPGIEIVLHGRKRRKLAWQQSPLTTCPGHVEQRIDDASQRGFRRAPEPLTLR